MARRSRRVLQLLVAICLLMTVALIPLVGSTDAAWTDEEHTRASFKATRLEPPKITACKPKESLIGEFTGVTIKWTSSYDKTHMRLTFDDKLIEPEYIDQSGNGPFHFEADLKRNFLFELLGNLLGSSREIRVEALKDNWSSEAATRTLSVVLLGLGSTCTAP